ncbi:MAG: enoyl-CoA hydratase/isomerase family protein [Chloroflexi bacterium]|nr:enoyl-CoA hydratase/isomerase family protein [Chloroflexota bacterium]
MSDTVLFELHTNGVGVITINRPEVRNAINWEAMSALSKRVTEAEAIENLHAIILTGAGTKAFISGGDIKDLHTTPTREDAYQQHDLMTATLGRLAELRIPVIAAMEGATRGGGCEVALACDLRIAAQDATLGFAQIKMGLTPGWGGARRLLSLVGYARATEILLTGATLTAPEAHVLGIVNHVTPKGEAFNVAMAMAERILNGPKRAIRGVVEVLRTHITQPYAEAVAREREVFASLWETDDHHEASSAFIEGRKPQFKDQ